ncbi:MAG: dihydropteroate synthase [Vicinamibacterales bacterium]
MYDDVVEEVAAELRAGLDVALAAGVSLERVIVDPGIGLPNVQRTVMVCWRGSTNLPTVSAGPCLQGRAASRSCVRPSAPALGPEARLGRTAAAVAAAVLAGAHIVRVHAVAEMVQVVRVAGDTRRYGRIAESGVEPVVNLTWIEALLKRPPIGLWDLADILVVSILICEVLKLIRGTRAVQMAVGAGLLALPVLRLALLAPRHA